MSLSRSIFALSLLAAARFNRCSSFSPACPLSSTCSQHDHSRVRSTKCFDSRAPPPNDTNDDTNDIDRNERIKDEIEDMKIEALRRIDALDSQMQVPTNDNQDSTTIDKKALAARSSPPTTPLPLPLPPRVPTTRTRRRSSSPTSSAPTTRAQRERSELALLDDTCWKITFNIGREPGTWMPKTWGESGERLLLSLTMKFTDQQMYEREEFLGGISDSKLLRVIDQQCTLGPSLTEGRRIVPVKDGAWRVAKGEGPKGSDIVRFYVEFEEQVSRLAASTKEGCGGASIPPGRVYATCGYFPTKNNRSSDRSSLSMKEMLENRDRELGNEYDKLAQEMDRDTRIVSWDKIKKGKRLSEIRGESKRLVERLNDAMVREPDKSILNASKNGLISLTKEGGLCIKVTKGMAVEYHILGKFGLAGVDQISEE